MKKIYTLLLIFTLATVPALSGCGGKKPSAKDSVKAIYDLYILRKTAGAEKLGMTEEDITEALDTYDHALEETIRSNFSTNGLEIDDETVGDICQARRNALSRMKATYTLSDASSESKNTAVVTVSTTYFNEEELDKNAFSDAKEAAAAADFASEDAHLNFIMETYTANLIDSYKNVSPSADTRDIAVTCVIVDGTWLPEDMAAFGSELGAAVAGQTE